MCDIDNYMCDRGSLIRVFMSSPQRYSLQRMLAISACFIAANAYNLARFVAVNAYNFGSIHCSEIRLNHRSECLQFRRDSLRSMLAFLA